MLASTFKSPLTLALILGLLTFLVFRGALENEFVNYDDPDYVTANPAVQSGLSSAGVRWAFTTGHAGNWHPLTWISHQADVQWHGLRPQGHHLTSLVLHSFNAGLVLILFWQLTRDLWRSALVAAFFAWHPLRVESVAWVAERKDLLCGLFFLLTLLVYSRYTTATPNPAPRTPHFALRSIFRLPASVWYWLALVCFACALMSKPMAISLPFVLLLLDYWPLNRTPHSALRAPRSVPSSILHPLSSTWPLLVEKLPFFLLAATSAVITYLVQQQGGAMSGITALPERLANAVVSYARYLAKTVWPDGLAVFYPYPDQWPALVVIGSAILLLLVSWSAVRWLTSRPALAVGWFWFLGMLVPTSGLIQVGGQSMADRYTYLPQIGLFLALLYAWSPSVVSSRPRIVGVVVLATMALGALAGQSYRQIKTWRNSESLFRHALAVTERNEVAHNNLGVALQKRGDWAAAAAEHAAALALKSRYTDAHINLGNCLLQLGNSGRASEHYRRAVELTPDVRTHYNLGTALLGLGQPAEAREHLRQAINLDPTQPEAQLNLGIVEARLGEFAAATRAFETALQLRPNYSEAWLQLGNTFAGQTNFAGAANAFARALEINPRDSTARFNLASAFVELGRLPAAIAALNDLLALSPADVDARRLLAHVSLRTGDIAAAVGQMDQVVRAAPSAVNHLEFAQVLLAAGRRTDAIAQFRAVLQLQPEHPVALNDLAWVVATHPDASVRDGAEAVRLAEKACTITERQNPLFLGTLAAAYAEAGRFPEAIRSAEGAIALAKGIGATSIVKRNEELMQLYRAGKPYHELR